MSRVGNECMERSSKKEQPIRRVQLVVALVKLLKGGDEWCRNMLNWGVGDNEVGSKPWSAGEGGKTTRENMHQN